MCDDIMRAMNKTLMILQGGPVQANIVRLAKQMGLNTVVIDRDPDAIGLKVADVGEAVDVIDKKSALKVAIEHHIDGVLAGGDVSLPTAAYISKKLGLICLTSDQAEIATNKELYYNLFNNNSIPYPKTRIVSTIEDCYNAIEDIGYPSIIKPTTSFGGSRGVRRINDIKDVDESFHFAKIASKNGRVMVEEFIDGEEHTIESLILNGKNHVLAISDKERISNMYCVATSLNYPSKLPEKTIRKMELIAQKVTDAIGLNNWISHIEVITYKNDIKIIDFGARGGGAGYIPTMIVPHISGVSMMEAFIQIILAEKNDIKIIKQNTAVVYRFFTPNPGKIVEIQGIDKLEHIDGLLDFHLNVNIGDYISEVNTQLDRAGYFVIKAKSLDLALEKAKEVEGLIKFITE